LESIRHWFESAETKLLRHQAESIEDHAPNHQAKLVGLTGLTIFEAQANYRKAVQHGLLKVLSKMGIASMSSYIGAQIFECVGLGPEVIERCFEGTVSRIGGLEVAQIEAESLRFHAAAYPKVEKLTNYGLMNHRVDGEFHGNNPQVVRALHAAIGLTKNGALPEERQAQFEVYSKLVRDRAPAALRDLLEFNSDRESMKLSNAFARAVCLLALCRKKPTSFWQSL
jgi:glutamate synthase (ferredoxin)